MSSFLKEKLEELKEVGTPPEICSKIEAYINDSPPPALMKVCPFRLADAWEMPRHAVLNAFLFATRMGVFNLEWDVRCPSCRGSTQLMDRLSLLKSRGHCDYCKIDIKPGFDDGVEVTFRVNPAVRELGEVDRGAVIRSRVSLEPGVTLSCDGGESQEIRMNLAEGAYHMFDWELGCAAPLWIRGEPTDTRREVAFAFDGSAVDRTETAQHTPGPFAVRLENRSQSPVGLTFARARDFPFVSGSEVASNQNFRDLFSTELISADESFSVQNLVFVFTDIKGSTDLYERLGDSSAYALVKEHFRIMNRVIANHHGAIVKTIGDAVMATFNRSEEAVQAVYAMHAAFDTFNRQEGTREEIIVKVGLHRGPCIAVTSNDKLDYFGRTVNIAARIQGLSDGKELMISRVLYDESSVRPVVEGSGWKAKDLQATLKGIAGAYDVVHISPP